MILEVFSNLDDYTIFFYMEAYHLFQAGASESMKWLLEYNRIFLALLLSFGFHN